MSLTKESIAEWFKSLQDDICHGLESLDGTGKFQEDKWTRPEGGGGRSRVITNGQVIEKGGVNFSAVEGPTPQKILDALKLPEADFFASGVSIVLHPNSPMTPIIHMNVRYFEMSDGTYWFGGGIDLTPHYVVKDDAKRFHQYLKDTCDKHDSEYYPKFKKWADDYFFIKHRDETRGIGGIFFDRLREDDTHSKEDIWEFVKAVGKTFVPAYSEMVNRSKDIEFGESEKAWQYHRRGRYVEFNLVWDKGTKFGLDTNGRTESILMSLPPQANWTYQHQVETNSREAETLSLLKKDIDWVNA